MPEGPKKKKKESIEKRNHPLGVVYESEKKEETDAL